MAAAVGLLVLAGCVVLVVVLTVADRQDDAARVGGILSMVFAAVPLAIPLIRWWCREAVNSAPTAGQNTIAEGTQPIGSPLDRPVSAWPHYFGDAPAVQAAGDRSVERTAKRRRAHTAAMIAFAAVISVVLTIVTVWPIVDESPFVAVDPVCGTATVRLEAERHPALFGSIWEPSAGQLWQARHGMGAAQYQQTFTDLVAQGYRLVRVSGYSDAGRDRYAAVWEQRPGPEWHARHGLTPDQYQQSFTELAAQGFRLVDVSGYGAGESRYAAVFEQVNGPTWQARHGLTSFWHQREFQQLAAGGMRLVAIDGHNPNG